MQPTELSLQPVAGPARLDTFLRTTFLSRPSDSRNGNVGWLVGWLADRLVAWSVRHELFWPINHERMNGS